MKSHAPYSRKNQARHKRRCPIGARPADLPSRMKAALLPALAAALVAEAVILCLCWSALAAWLGTAFAPSGKVDVYLMLFSMAVLGYGLLGSLLLALWALLARLLGWAGGCRAADSGSRTVALRAPGAPAAGDTAPRPVREAPAQRQPCETALCGNAAASRDPALRGRPETPRLP